MADSDSDGLQLEENDDDGGLELEENNAESDDGLQLEENINDGNASDDDGLQLEEQPDDEDEPVVLEANIASASELKDRGNLAFKEGRLRDARDAYSAGLLVAVENAERSTLLTNRAAVAVKLSDWSSAINDCTAALSVSAISSDTRTKALFRRATAFLESGDAEGARRDLSQFPEGDITVKKLRARLLESDNNGTATANATGGAVVTNGSSASRRWRVSCISPTTPERHLFHETALYRCFNAQTHPDIELIVVDTGSVPSPFFTDKGSPGKEDKRVTYLWQEKHQTIGEKRNLAIQHASGDIICHFDDDDLYAPQYIETMVKAMEKDNADFVKLSAWLVHDLQTDATGLFDAETPMPHEQLKQLREQFLFTYGFSFLYRKALFPTFSFLATSWGEDQDILRRVRDAGKKLTLHRDLKGLCLHNQHGENCSRSFAQVPVSRQLLEASPLGEYLDALPIIGKALARRGVGMGTLNDVVAAGEEVAYNGKKVVVQSTVVGGLFVWLDELQRNGNDVDATLESFTHWLWSGNGFSKERYAKLGLEKPRPPESLLKKVAAEQDRMLEGPPQQKQIGFAAATAHGLESLRAFEGMSQPHAAGAITNPSAYKDPSKKSAAPQEEARQQEKPKPAMLPSFGTGFGNPTRGFSANAPAPPPPKW